MSDKFAWSWLVLRVDRHLAGRHCGVDEGATVLGGSLSQVREAGRLGRDLAYELAQRMS